MLVAISLGACHNGGAGGSNARAAQHRSGGRAAQPLSDARPNDPVPHEGRASPQLGKTRLDYMIHASWDTAKATGCIHGLARAATTGGG
jgi:hypothetical protein